ncbi:hypothetical protein [Arthrobacter sp. OY3WO11]|uniref:glycosyltransferase family 2 protein n=1 Tax=Arthrobacter sp. OY3WO11 TaxID=1835723 RepID=UPI000A9BA72E|nr:hypothetical protein [Arthrobacter sp. OY3WO11]
MTEPGSVPSKAQSNLGQTAKIGVSVVNYFSSTSVKLLLDSLAEFADGCQILVTIVDNSQDSGRREAELLRDIASIASGSYLQVEVIEAEQNLGYGAGNNLGVRRLIERGATLLWVLNPDTVVHGSATSLANEADSRPAHIWSTVTKENGVISNGLGMLNTLTGRARASSSSTVGLQRFGMRYPGGHSIVFSVEAWQQLNGFDEDYFLFMEEADVTVRSQALGMTVATLGSVIVHHDQGLTTGSTRNIRLKSSVAFTAATTSRIVFFSKFYPRRLPFVLMCRLAYLITILLRGNLGGAKAVAKGIHQGLSLIRERKDRGHEQ